jgi:hypothetical protein
MFVIMLNSIINIFLLRKIYNPTSCFISEYSSLTTIGIAKLFMPTKFIKIIVVFLSGIIQEILRIFTNTFWLSEFVNSIKLFFHKCNLFRVKHFLIMAANVLQLPEGRDFYHKT